MAEQQSGPQHDATPTTTRVRTDADRHPRYACIFSPSRRSGGFSSGRFDRLARPGLSPPRHPESPKSFAIEEAPPQGVRRYLEPRQSGLGPPFRRPWKRTFDWARVSHWSRLPGRFGAALRGLRRRYLETGRRCRNPLWHRDDRYRRHRVSSPSGREGHQTPDSLARPVVYGVSTKPTRKSAAAGPNFGKLLIS